MMRLTEKKENGFYELTKGNEIYGEENGIRLVQIIGQYEDIKEEYGNYMLLIKALIQSRVYVKLQKGIYRRKVHSLKFDNYFRIMIWKYRAVSLQEYGKTWALTKEELC